ATPVGTSRRARVCSRQSFQGPGQQTVRREPWRPASQSSARGRAFWLQRSSRHLRTVQWAHRNESADLNLRAPAGARCAQFTPKPITVSTPISGLTRNRLQSARGRGTALIQGQLESALDLEGASRLVSQNRGNFRGHEEREIRTARPLEYGGGA